MFQETAVEGVVEADALQTDACDAESASRVELSCLVDVLGRGVLAIRQSFLDECLRGLYDNEHVEDGDERWEGGFHLRRKAFPFLSAEIVETEGLVDPSVVPFPVLIEETFYSFDDVSSSTLAGIRYEPVGLSSFGAKSTTDHLCAVLTLGLVLHLKTGVK